MSQIVNGQEKVLMYASAPFTKSKLNYIVYQKECLAVHWAVLLFHHYVAREKFVVRSYCKALEWLKTKPLGDIVVKWYTQLQHYDFEVKYRPGCKSMNVDGLTRQPISNASCYGVPEFPELDNIKPRNIVIKPVQTRRQQEVAASKPQEIDPHVAIQEFKDNAIQEIKEDAAPTLVDDDSDDDFEEITQSAFFKCPEDLEGW